MYQIGVVRIGFNGLRCGHRLGDPFKPDFPLPNGILSMLAQ
jgi:hypothetical protein